MGDTRSAPSLSTPVEIARLIHDLGVALLQRLQMRDTTISATCFFKSP